MGFLETVEQARAFLERNRRVSLRGLCREFELDDDALEGECKRVTVLFADVKGSMELAEQLDPEEWDRIL